MCHLWIIFAQVPTHGNNKKKKLCLSIFLWKTCEISFSMRFFLSCYNKYVFLNFHLKNLTELFLLLCLFVCLNLPRINFLIFNYQAKLKSKNKQTKKTKQQQHHQWIIFYDDSSSKTLLLQAWYGLRTGVHWCDPLALLISKCHVLLILCNIIFNLLLKRKAFMISK